MISAIHKMKKYFISVMVSYCHISQPWWTACHSACWHIQWSLVRGQTTARKCYTSFYQWGENAILTAALLLTAVNMTNWVHPLLVPPDFFFRPGRFMKVNEKGFGQRITTIPLCVRAYMRNSLCRPTKGTVMQKTVKQWPFPGACLTSDVVLCLLLRLDLD